MSLLSPDENGEGSLAAGGSGKQHRGGACMGGGECKVGAASPCQVAVGRL